MSSSSAVIKGKFNVIVIHEAFVAASRCSSVWQPFVCLGLRRLLSPRMRRLAGAVYGVDYASVPRAKLADSVATLVYCPHAPTARARPVSLGGTTFAMSAVAAGEGSRGVSLVPARNSRRIPRPGDSGTPLGPEGSVCPVLLSCGYPVRTG